MPGQLFDCLSFIVFQNIRMLGCSAPLTFYELHPKSVIFSSCVCIKHRAFKIDDRVKVLVIDKK